MKWPGEPCCKQKRLGYPHQAHSYPVLCWIIRENMGSSSMANKKGKLCGCIKDSEGLGINTSLFLAVVQKPFQHY